MLRRIAILALALCVSPLRADDRPTMPEIPPTLPTSEPAATTVPASQPAAALSMSFASADHRSGIYYAKDPATFSLFVENSTDAPAALTGNIYFGPIAINNAPYKPISITPITPTQLAPHQRAQLNISATFAAPGTYEIRWDDHPIVMPDELTLRCIFPPRPAGGPSPFIARLPAAAVQPGFLDDYITRTGISRFVIEDTWPPPRAANATLITGPVPISALQLDELAKDKLQKNDKKSAKNAKFLIKFALLGPISELNPVQLHDHVVVILEHTGSLVEGIVLNSQTVAPADHERVISCYLATYDAVKKRDKNLLMLGVGGAEITESILFHKSSHGNDLLQYVDAIATMPGPGELGRLRTNVALWQNRPLWMLPPSTGSELFISPGLALGENLVTVPVSEEDRGVTLQLFGGAVLFERVHPELPFTINAYQGNGYAVAAICGLGAGSANEAAWPGLQVSVGKEVAPTLEVADEAHGLRVVDEAGFEVECRNGAADVLQIPLGKRVLYLLQTGSAQDLVALLRAAPVHDFPWVEARAELVPAAGADAAALKITLRNATTEALTGKFRVVIKSPEKMIATSEPADTSEKVLGEKNFREIASAKAEEFRFPWETGAIDGGKRLVLEMSVDGMTQHLPVFWGE